MPIILNALINAEVGRISGGLGGAGYKKVSGNGATEMMENAIMKEVRAVKSTTVRNADVHTGEDKERSESSSSSSSTAREVSY